MSFSDTWKAAAAESGRRAATQAKKAVDLAGAGVKLLRLKRELEVQYAEIGKSCWKNYRQQMSQLFPQQFSRIQAVEEERSALEKRLRESGKDGGGP